MSSRPRSSWCCPPSSSPTVLSTSVLLEAVLSASDLLEAVSSASVPLEAVPSASVLPVLSSSPQSYWRLSYQPWSSRCSPPPLGPIGGCPVNLSPTGGCLVSLSPTGGCLISLSPTGGCPLSFSPPGVVLLPSVILEAVLPASVFLGLSSST